MQPPVHWPVKPKRDKPLWWDATLSSRLGVTRGFI
jgi:hypothetical protein